jgi:hypothetical protein
MPRWKASPRDGEMSDQTGRRERWINRVVKTDLLLQVVLPAVVIIIAALVLTVRWLL